MANAEVGDLSCFSVDLQYDPFLLEIVSSSEGAIFAASLDPTFYQQESTAPGDDSFSDCVLGFGTSVASPGELFRIRFKALTAGSSPIDLVQVELRDVDRALIPGIVVSGGSANLSLTSVPSRGLRSIRVLATPNPSNRTSVPT